MHAFEVAINGKRTCLAGIGEHGVLTVTVDHVARKDRNEIRLRVGGLIGPTGEHVQWRSCRLKTGDEVRVLVVQTEKADRPRQRYRVDPKRDLNAQKRYVREMARKFGWQITTHRTKGDRTL